MLRNLTRSLRTHRRLKHRLPSEERRSTPGEGGGVPLHHTAGRSQESLFHSLGHGLQLGTGVDGLQEAACCGGDLGRRRGRTWCFAGRLRGVRFCLSTAGIEVGVLSHAAPHSSFYRLMWGACSSFLYIGFKKFTWHDITAALTRIWPFWPILCNICTWHI